MLHAKSNKGNEDVSVNIDRCVSFRKHDAETVAFQFDNGTVYVRAKFDDIVEELKGRKADTIDIRERYR